MGDGIDISKIYPFALQQMGAAFKHCAGGIVRSGELLVNTHFALRFVE